MDIMDSERHSTTGILYMWGGTKDNQDGRINYLDGSTNLNEFQPFNVTVSDIRNLPQTPSLNKNGYALVTAKTVLTRDQLLNCETPQSSKVVQEVYLSEIRNIIEKLSGSKEIYPVAYKVRQEISDPEEALKEQKGRALPRPLAHVDRDLPTAIAQLETSLGVARANKLRSKYGRWAMVNVWRPIGEIIQKWPLIMIDHSSIPNWSYDTHLGRVYAINDAQGKNRGGKGHDCILKQDPGYKYYFASDMAPDETLVFYSFHTDPRMVAPHSALRDNNSPLDAPPRCSIETRSWVFFD